MKRLHLAPSILSADMARLGEEIRECRELGADYIHIDVMDGMFVPNLTLGAPVIRSLRSWSDAVFDVHLMIEEPKRYIDDFCEAGADIISVHVEAAKHLDSTIEDILSHGIKAGAVLNPATPIEMLSEILGKLDMVLLMSVNPGFGNQRFIPYVSDKIRRLRAMAKMRGLDLDIEVDGGVNSLNAGELIDAGANILVAGNAIFKGDKKDNIDKFLRVMAGYE